MKKISKTTDIVTLALIIMLVFLCMANITYAYFSATKSVTGQTQFANFGVNFRYRNSSSQYITVAESELDLYPVDDVIAVGSAIDLRLEDGNTISLIGLELATGSADAYVRFWIDAFEYVDNVQQSTNYGKYFQFVDLNLTYFSTSLRTIGSNQNNIYYYKNSITSGSGINIASQIMMSEDVPTEIFGKSIKISIGFDAVQSANQAYLSVFDDEKGYLASWS